MTSRAQISARIERQIWHDDEVQRLTNGGRLMSIYCDGYNAKRWAGVGDLVLDAHEPMPEVAELSRMHHYGVCLRWNRMPRAHGWGMEWGEMFGYYNSTFLAAGEDPLEVVLAALRAWIEGDTTGCLAITERRIAMLPSLDEYVRGTNKHVRLPDGTTAQIVSMPKRGGYRVSFGPRLNNTFHDVADLSELA